MRTIIVIVFIIACAYVGINMIKGFAEKVETHNQRIERVAGY